MRAAVLHRGVLAVQERPIPEPVGGDVLVAVTRAGLCGSDLRLGRDGLRGVADDGPVLLGHEVVGTVVAHGPRAGGHPPLGSRVAALPCLRRPGRLEWFGESATVPGAFAEFCLVDSAMCVPVPEELSDRAATFIEPLAVAVHAVARSGLRSSDKPVVVGAGPLGLAVIVALRAHGAADVLAIECRPERRELARAAGAAAVDRLGDEGALAYLAGADFAVREGVHMLPDTADDPRTVVFECAGSETALTQICEEAPNGTRVVALGLHSGNARIPVRAALTKQVELRFVIVYNLTHFAAAARIAAAHAAFLDSLVDVELSLGQLARCWPGLQDELSPAHGKVVVVPSRDLR